MTTLNQIADGLQSAIEALGPTVVRVYSEPVETPEEPKGGATAEIVFLREDLETTCTRTSWFSIEVSVSADAPDWSARVRLLRPYMDAGGARSIRAALLADLTLGGIGSITFINCAEGERRVKYGAATRWRGRWEVSVSHD